MEKEIRFAFEDLEVWQEAVRFATKVIDITENIKTSKKHYGLIEQVEASVTSIASSIAEGKGRYSKKEFIQFLYIARGSLYETITRIILFYSKGWITKVQLEEMKIEGNEIGKMLSGFINSIRRSMKL